MSQKAEKIPSAEQSYLLEIVISQEPVIVIPVSLIVRHERIDFTVNVRKQSVT